MDDLKNNKLVWVVIATSVFLFGIIGFRLMVNQVSNHVIEQLQKEYSPSPYGPGVDPDKVSPDVLQQQPRRAIQQLPSNNYQLFQEDGRVALESSVWREDWERERGFTEY